MKIRTLAVCLATAAARAGVARAADDAALRATARSVLEKNAPAVVIVHLTVKTRVVFQGQERSGPETTMEIAGTVLTPGGLTVVSDFSSNPMGMFQGSPDGPKFDTETSDVKLVFRDGREIPARFVLRDQDLDLAFLVPQDKGVTLPALELVKGAVPDLLDDVVFLYPLGKGLNREVAVATDRVRAVVRKPRTLVVSDAVKGLQSLGCPVFDATGRAIGLALMRRLPGGISMSNPKDIFEMLNPVVLTAEDVLQTAAQAQAAAAK
jgi:S1-C subfamily serine protease